MTFVIPGFLALLTAGLPSDAVVSLAIRCLPRLERFHASLPVGVEHFLKLPRGWRNDEAIEGMCHIPDTVMLRPVRANERQSQPMVVSLILAGGDFA